MAVRIPLDPDSDLVASHCALVHSPRRHRDRFPEGSVTLVADEAAALAGADPAANLHPARVVGPSRSSEGTRLYYLERWLRGPAEII